jgi:PAS domain S-box-containing protein
MVEMYVYEITVAALIILIGVFLYVSRTSKFKGLANKRLQVLFDITKIFYRKKHMDEIVDQTLKSFIGSLPKVSFGGVVLCDEEGVEYAKTYDVLKGYADVEIPTLFYNRLKESRVYFSINEEERMLNYPFLDVGSRSFPYHHVLKFSLDENSFGAFIIATKKIKIEPYEYEFLRIFVEHFAQGLRNKYLAKQVSHFTKTIDVLEHTYQRIVDNLPVGVVGVDNKENYNVLLWNELMEQMFNISAEDMLDRSVSQMFFRQTNRKIIMELLEHTRDSKEIQEIPVLNYFTKEGEKKNFLVICYLLRDYESGFDGSILVFKDITENVFLEGKLKRAQEIKEEDNI